MRAGIAPFGGAGGSGLVMSRLPDGSWSAPSMLTPQNLSVGFLIGLDILDVVLIINSPAALEGFKSHKFTLGGEIGVAAGPLGAGASAEASVKEGKLVPPIYSYVKSRGLYAGVEIIGQVFLTRFDENERVYHHPGVTGRAILDGKVRMPPEVASLHKTLQEAEKGTAQLV
jgi:SH3 domain-containing YSC84-like protein 1